MRITKCCEKDYFRFQITNLVKERSFEVDDELVRTMYNHKIDFRNFRVSNASAF